MINPVPCLSARATTVSPWHDNLRFMYEAGRSVRTLAYWHGVDDNTMRAWLRKAGTAMKKGRREFTAGSAS